MVEVERVGLGVNQEQGKEGHHLLVPLLQTRMCRTTAGGAD